MPLLPLAYQLCKDSWSFKSSGQCVILYLWRILAAETSLAWFPLSPLQTLPLELPQLLYSPLLFLLLYMALVQLLLQNCDCKEEKLTEAQVKSEGVLLQDSTERKHTWPELNLGSRKPSVGWEVVSLVILLWFSVCFFISTWLFSQIFLFLLPYTLKSGLCRGILVYVTFDTIVCDASSQPNSM